MMWRKVVISAKYGYLRRVIITTCVGVLLFTLSWTLQPFFLTLSPSPLVFPVEHDAHTEARRTTKTTKLVIPEDEDTIHEYATRLPNITDSEQTGISVIIPIPVRAERNTMETFFASLNALAKYPLLEVVVVKERGATLPYTAGPPEDGSPLNLVEVDYGSVPSSLGRRSPTTRHSFSWAAACNHGAVFSKYSTLVFLSAEATLRNNVIQHLMNALNSGSNVGIAGCRLITNSTNNHYQHSVILNHGFDVVPLQDDVPVVIASLEGYSSRDSRLSATATDAVFVDRHCLAISRGLFWRLDGFDISIEPGRQHHGARTHNAMVHSTDDLRHHQMTQLPTELDGVAVTFDLCLRARSRGHKAVVSKGSMHYNKGPHFVMDTGHTYGIQLKEIGDQFEDKWKSFLVALQRERESPDRSSRILLVWDTFCVRCFGFSTEVLHFVVPLELMFHTPVRLVPTEDCFCGGFPTQVHQSLRRLSHFKHWEEIFNRKTDDTQWNEDEDVLVWVSHKDPGSYTTFPNQLLDSRADYIVGRSMFEYSRFPPEWLERCNNDDLVDEIWVPSTFVRKIFEDSGVQPEKLYVVPEAMDTYLWDPNAVSPLTLPDDITKFGWTTGGLGEHQRHLSDNFKFMSMFKWEQRKGWDILLEAFFKEFTPDEPVSLYIVTYIWGSDDSRNPQTLVQIARDWATSKGLSEHHLQFITEAVPETDLVRVYRSMDAFAMPTHGEGWGLPIIQGMAMGLPTIATNWSGNVDFMQSDNSYLIRSKVTHVPDSLLEDQLWAEPSVDHLRELMRFVYEHPEEAKKVGAKGREHIVGYFSEGAVGEIVESRLDKIKEKVLKKRKQHKMEKQHKEYVDSLGLHRVNRGHHDQDDGTAHDVVVGLAKEQAEEEEQKEHTHKQLHGARKNKGADEANIETIENEVQEAHHKGEEEDEVDQEEQEEVHHEAGKLTPHHRLIKKKHHNKLHKPPKSMHQGIGTIFHKTHTK